MNDISPMRVRPDMVRAAAISHGVCPRPLLHQVHDTVTGKTTTAALPCGSTRESQCPPCADAARRLRMAQCREGWHLTDEPAADSPTDAGDDACEEPDDDAGEDFEGETSESEGEGSSRRTRSTRRRQDSPDLPRLPMADTTLGKRYEGDAGRVYTPSMFLTLTLPSYGPVHPDGTPRDPDTYDYHRAGLDAMHYGALADRFWQNMRRCAGYKVQYFATVEPQKRLAPHLHAAIRGAIPRAVIRQVAAATYHQVWWPPHEEPVYTGANLPHWDTRAGGYVDPHTGQPLSTWDEALDQLDAAPAARPAHVVRFGQQVDMQGILPGTPDADRRIGYLTKYLTKSIADTYGDPAMATRRQRAHLNRLHAVVRYLPCSPECANWLRFGVQPRNCEPGMTPGGCDRKAHKKSHLGYGGRRVLVSRKWTGKTLAEHKADRAEVVRQTLAAAGIEPDTDPGGYSATTTDEQGRPRYLWSPVKAAELDLDTWRNTVLAGIDRRQAWRDQYEQAKQRAGPDAGTHAGGYSATHPAATAA